MTLTLKVDFFLRKMSWTMTFESEGCLIDAFNIWLPPASYVVFLTTLVYIKLLCMHGALTCNIVANYSAVQY